MHKGRAYRKDHRLVTRVVVTLAAENDETTDSPEQSRKGPTDKLRFTGRDSALPEIISEKLLSAMANSVTARRS